MMRVDEFVGMNRQHRPPREAHIGSETLDWRGNVGVSEAHTIFCRNLYKLSLFNLLPERIQNRPKLLRYAKFWGKIGENI